MLTGRPRLLVAGAAALLLTSVALAGCSDDSRPTRDSGVVDAWAPDRAPPGDGRTPEARTDARRDGAAVPLPGLGTLSGECGVLDDTEWGSTQPFLFRNVLDLGTATFDSAKLSTGGATIFTDGNLGGSSIHSEVFAYEVLYRCELARLLKSESKVGYKDAAGKKTDILTEIDGRPVGVSVTRAYAYPPTNPYTEAQAKSLLEKKLADLPLSQANALPADAWTRSFLHVFAYTPQHADAVQSAWGQISASVKGSAIVIVTVTEGNDSYIYSN